MKEQLTALKTGAKPAMRIIVRDEELRDLRKADLRIGFLGSAHWFKDASWWIQLSKVRDSPYLVAGKDSELALLKRCSIECAGALSEHRLIIMGVGNGSKELVLVKELISIKKYAEIVGIDINIEFLRKFAASLARQADRYNNETEIKYLGLKTLFESIVPSDLLGIDGKYRKRALICLGNSIGNMGDTIQFLLHLRSLSRPGDFLILGYRLASDLKNSFERYRRSVSMGNWLHRIINSASHSKIIWSLDEKRQEIQAWSGRIQIFRSKRFDSNILTEWARAARFDTVYLKEDPARTVAFHMFRRIG